MSTGKQSHSSRQRQCCIFTISVSFTSCTQKQTTFADLHHNGVSPRHQFGQRNMAGGVMEASISPVLSPLIMQKICWRTQSLGRWWIHSKEEAGPSATAGAWGPRTHRWRPPSGRDNREIQVIESPRAKPEIAYPKQARSSQKRQWCTENLTKGRS